MEPLLFTVVTGLLEIRNPDNSVHNFVNVILRTHTPENTVICTWNSERQHTHALERAGFTVLYEDPPLPPIPSNPATRQSHLITLGIVHALAKGATHVLRFRTDIECPNLYEFKNLLYTNYAQSDKLSVLCGIEVRSGAPYFLDVLVFGKVEQMHRMFLPLQTAEDERYVETFWMETYAGARELTRDQMREIFNFFALENKRAGIQLHWHAKNYDYTLSDPCANPCMWV
jgi:hypothetical protein